MRALLVLSFVAILLDAQSLSVRPSGSSLGRIRLGAADPIWFHWYVALPADSFGTLVDAAVKADSLSVGSIIGSNRVTAAAEVPKKTDFRLQKGERAALITRLGEYNVQMRAYMVDALPSGDELRRTLEFAKALGSGTVLVDKAVASVEEIDRVATEVEINVALGQKPAPDLSGRSKRIGLAIAVGDPVTDRVMAIQIRDTHSSTLSDFLLAAYRSQTKPLIIALYPGANPAKTIDEFEAAMRPAMIARVKQVVDSPQGAIRGADRLTAEMRSQIEAAVPTQVLAKPKRPRKLLVFDLNMWSGHATIPHGNYLIELMGKKTGAYDTVFSNDLNNLKYDKIKQFDAVFLNNVVGMVFPDPEVRSGLLRFVKEGGGLGGIHGTTYAALDWPEFTEMLGGSAGAHHTEKQVLKVDDPSSPLNAGFNGKPFEHTDEFYHFAPSTPYSRNKLHVLLSIDVEKSDMATSNKLCAQCTRPDQDYGMSWVKRYGKGRVFCTPLGHTTTLFTTPAWTRHILGGIQFMLGDLELPTP